MTTVVTVSSYFFPLFFPDFFSSVQISIFSLEFGSFECLFIDVARTCVCRPRGRFNKLLPIEKEILKNHVLVCFYLNSRRDSGVSERVVKTLNLVPKITYLTGQVRVVCLQLPYNEEPLIKPL